MKSFSLDKIASNVYRQMDIEVGEIFTVISRRDEILTPWGTRTVFMGYGFSLIEDWTSAYVSNLHDGNTWAVMQHLNRHPIKLGEFFETKLHQKEYRRGIQNYYG